MFRCVEGRLTRIARALCGVLLCSATFISAAQAQFVATRRAGVPAIEHQEWATQVLFTPRGERIISAGLDGRVIIRETGANSGSSETRLPAGVLALAASPDGATLAAGDAGGAVRLIDLANGKVRAALAADKRVANAVAWGALLAAGGSEGVVRLWRADGTAAGEVAPGRGDIVSLLFVPGGERLVVGTLDRKKRAGAIEVWDVRRRTRVLTIDAGSPGVRAASVSPDGRLLAVGNFRPATLLSVLPIDEGGKFEASVRALGEDDDPTPVAVWELATGRQVATVGAETGARAVNFSPDGKLLACAGAHGVMFYDAGASTFVEVGRIDSRTSIDALAFAPGSTRAAARLVLARERFAPADQGRGGAAQLLASGFVAATMLAKDGMSSGVTLGVGQTNAADSVTGGALVEVWDAQARTAQADARLWSATRTYFDGDEARARKEFDGIIKDHPTHGEARRLCAVLFEASDARRVRETLAASVKTDPNCAACWRSLGDVEFAADDFAAAARSYEEALRLQPAHGVVAGRLAQSYNAVALGSLNPSDGAAIRRARENIEQALRLRPGDAQFRANLATTYYFAGDMDEAIRLLLIAQRLRPDHARIYYNLGHAYREKGDRARALEAYRRYVRLGEPGEESRVDRARRLIAELGG